MLILTAILIVREFGYHPLNIPLHPDLF
jgi:hypothetical protein